MFQKSKKIIKYFSLPRATSHYKHDQVFVFVLSVTWAPAKIRQTPAELHFAQPAHPQTLLGQISNTATNSTSKNIEILEVQVFEPTYVVQLEILCILRRSRDLLDQLSKGLAYLDESLSAVNSRLSWQQVKLTLLTAGINKLWADGCGNATFQACRF